MRRLLLITMTGLLIGCGGGESSSDESQTTSDATVSEEEGGEEATDEAGETSGETGTTEEEGGEGEGTESTTEEEGGEEGAGTESSEEGGESGTENSEAGEGEEGSESIFVDEGGTEGEVEPGLAAFGEACGYTDTCAPDIEDENGELIENPDWPGCLSAQCESGICNFPACSRFCETDTDCEGAAEGPLGAKWSCAVANVTLTGKEIKECRPGTAFAECTSNSDCPEGELCQIDYLNGDYGTYCFSAVVDGADIGEPCNRDPRYGDVQLCGNGMCSGLWCLGLCGDSADCGDNPYFDCQQDYFYSDLNQEFSYCYPRNCELDSDCDDIDGAYCRVLLTADNAVEQKVEYWDHACWPADEGTVGPGEACTSDDSGPQCENGFLCINSVCSTQCKSDDDCTVDGMDCQVIEYTVDGFSFEFPLNLCVYSEGSKTACSKETDCGDGESCNSIELEVGPFEYTLAGQCETADSSYGGLGAACDEENPCQTGLCLNYTDSPNLCAGHCDASADCGSVLDENGAELNGFCTSFRWESVGTSTLLDDLYLPLCYFDSGSGADCSADYVCGEGETCSPLVVTSLPTDTPVISWACTSLTASANGEMGADCESGNQCASGLCVLPAWGSDPGYCSMYCSDAVPCGDMGEEEGAMECNDYVLIEREDADKSAVVQRCEMP